MAHKLFSHKACQYFRNSIFTNLVMMSISENKDQYAGINKIKKKILSLVNLLVKTSLHYNFAQAG